MPILSLLRVLLLVSTEEKEANMLYKIMLSKVKQYIPSNVMSRIIALSKTKGKQLEAQELLDKALAKINTTEIKSISKIADRAMELINKYSNKTVNTNINKKNGKNKISSSITKETEELQEETDTDNKETNYNNDFANLSSSWIIDGIYSSSSLGRGRVWIHTKQGKKYLYFGVKEITWEHMKEATGSYGTGAGSVFWREFNRSYINKGKGFRRQANRTARFLQKTQSA